MTISYGEFIKAHRIKSGYGSQRKLAEKMNVSNSTIAKIEKEVHKPDAKTLKEMSKYLTSTSLVELMVVCGYWDEEDLLEELPSSALEILGGEQYKDSRSLNKSFETIETNEDKFIEDLDLANEELYKKYDIKIDGEKISKEEADMFIASIRALRSMRKSFVGK